MCLGAYGLYLMVFFFFSSRRRHTRYWRDWSSDVCSSDLHVLDVECLPHPLGVHPHELVHLLRVLEGREGRYDGGAVEPERQPPDERAPPLQPEGVPDQREERPPPAPRVRPARPYLPLRYRPEAHEPPPPPRSTSGTPPQGSAARTPGPRDGTSRRASPRRPAARAARRRSSPRRT